MTVAESLHRVEPAGAAWRRRPGPRGTIGGWSDLDQQESVILAAVRSLDQGPLRLLVDPVRCLSDAGFALDRRFARELMALSAFCATPRKAYDEVLAGKHRLCGQDIEIATFGPRAELLESAVVQTLVAQPRSRELGLVASGSDEGVFLAGSGEQSYRVSAIPGDLAEPVSYVWAVGDVPVSGIGTVSAHAVRFHTAYKVTAGGAALVVTAPRGSEAFRRLIGCRAVDRDGNAGVASTLVSFRGS